MRRVFDFILMVFCGTIWILLGMLSAIASPQMQVREQNQSRKHKNFLGKDDCLFNARSPYIQCAVNPSEVCDKCIYFVES
ncbi:hypothetical protein IQ259_14035 [Fortiea sp. LEGE XX443]|uniref:DUF6464 family protein n=1 Tax=Fortiea sp. LEGE XX443 TaxID=1828611 RepID=UPI00187E931F|nr:DUF6464 family protein [Fortiea sp. LEGE XX443]MBE9006141.1 hypothetical protein [Fortiea sp. LEGE XX443]